MHHAILSGSWKLVATGFETFIALSEWRDRQTGRYPGKATAQLLFDKKHRPLVAPDGYVVKAPLRGGGYRLLYAGTDFAAAQGTAKSYNSGIRNSDYLATIRKSEGVIYDHFFEVVGNAGQFYLRLPSVKDHEDALLVFLGVSGGGGRSGFVCPDRGRSTAMVVACATATAPHMAACEVAAVFRPGDELVMENRQSFDDAGDSRTSYEVYSYYGREGLKSPDPRDAQVIMEMERMSADAFDQREQRIRRIIANAKV